MKRYAYILRLFWSTALSAEMEYRSNFALACITSVGHLIGSIFIIWVFFEKLQVLGGYTFDQALVILGFFVLLEGLANSVMRRNLSRIIAHVRKGTLDFILLKPIDTQFWLSLRNCSPWGIPNMCLGVGLIFYAASQLGLSPLDYLAGLIPLALGIVMLYGLWFLLGALCIWFVRIPNITHVLYQLLEAGRFPVSAYPPLYQFVFTFIIPVAFLTTFPAEAMIGVEEGGAFSHTWVLLLTSFVLAAALFTGARAFFYFALRYYTSASS